MRRRIGVLAVLCGVFLFASATTFQSLGIVVFAMAAQWRWSDAAAGGAFTSLGLACCASSLLPVMLIARVGARWTLVGGTLFLAAGYGLAAHCASLATLYSATALLGVGFSLVANTPAIFLIGAWFAARTPLMISVYLMCGTLGGVVGPPTTAWLMVTHGGWRGYWTLLAGAALGFGLLCAWVIREPASRPAAAEQETLGALGLPWGYRAALATPQFAVLALVMVATQGALTVVASIAAAHFALAGSAPSYAAQALASIGLVSAGVTGVSGRLTDRLDPKHLQAVGVLFMALALGLMAATRLGATTDLFLILFGSGTALASLAVTVLLIRYFGPRSGTAALSFIWMLSGVAAAGPPLFGWVADRSGSFAPALRVFGLLLLPLAIASWCMQPPRERWTTMATATVEGAH